MSSEVVGNEIVFGLISPIGINTTQFQHTLTNILKEFNYQLEPIKVSSFLEDSITSDNRVVSTNPYNRKNDLINEGDQLRKTHGNNYLAKLAIANIFAIRNISENHLIIGGRKVFFINGIKHYSEVDLLRSLYGTSFFLIGLSASENDRHRYMKDILEISDQNATELLLKEQDNDNTHGQQLSKTFYRSDVFIPFSSDIEMEKELRRFVDLVFGHPYHTPRVDEHMMFHAYAASLRSADLSRQVGAVISTPQGDIISSGANDVPKFEGGQYWPNDAVQDSDNRDFIRKYDSNKQQRSRIIENIIATMNKDPQLSDFSTSYPYSSSDGFYTAITKALNDSELKSITEYGRAVHAEMAAITTASRLGTATKGGYLYSTTFPCHNCAKHIIASGISRVVYVEPYAKSLAYTLHGDSACQGPMRREDDIKKVVFEPFIGIGPRRFFDLFSLTLSNGDQVKRNIDGKIIDFQKKKTNILPRIRMNMNSIIEQEENCFLETFSIVPQGGTDGQKNAKREGKTKLSKPKRSTAKSKKKQN